MKIEYKIVVRKPGKKWEIRAYSENRAELEHAAEVLSKQNPSWEVRVVRETYNVS